MSRINLGRVLIGGLIAGVILNAGEFLLNGVLLAEDMNSAMIALNRPPIAPAMILWFVIFSFGFASGLTLYWVTSNVIGIAQQAAMNQTRFGREMRAQHAKKKDARR